MGIANMLAIILENNEEYVSPVFAIRQAGWQSEALAFNKERTHLRRIKIWHPRRQVFIVDWEKFNCKKFAWEGYDWVLQDNKLWKAVRFGKKASTNEFPQFKEYTKEMVLPEWFEVKGKRDIQSLMNVSMSFHDSIPTRIDKSENGTEIEFDTTRGCIITVKFEGVRASELVDRIGIIYDSVLEKTDGGYVWKVTCFDAGKAGGIVGFLPVSGEPYIECDKIEWSIKIGKSKLCAKTKGYDTLYDFYLDLKSASEDVFLKEDKLILHHKNDTLIIEEGSKGYITTLNGRKERGQWEEQDIFEYAREFLTQVNPEDIKEEVLLDVISAKPLYFWHYMKYAFLFAVAWAFVGVLILFLTNFQKGGVLVAVLFFALCLVTIIFPLCSLVNGKEIRYIITATKIYYFIGNVSNLSLNISQIKDIKLYRSLIEKEIGTIKIKQKGGITFGYGLIAVNDAEKVYNLIRQKCEF